MNRAILIVFSTLLFIIIGSFLYIQIYLGFHVDAIESTNETENFEYYYNDTLNKEEPAMSSTGTYPVTSSGIDLDALKEPEKKKPKNTSSKNDFTPKKLIQDLEVISNLLIVIMNCQMIIDQTI